MTAAEAGTFWQELEAALRELGSLRQPPEWRRRRCGEMVVRPGERRAIQAFHLIDGLSLCELARRFCRHRNTVTRILQEPAYQAFAALYRRTS